MAWDIIDGFQTFKFLYYPSDPALPSHTMLGGVNIHKNQDQCSKFGRVHLYWKGENFETINIHNVITIIFIQFVTKNIHATGNNWKLMHITINSSEIYLDIVVVLERVLN